MLTQTARTPVIDPDFAGGASALNGHRRSLALKSANDQPVNQVPGAKKRKPVADHDKSSLLDRISIATRLWGIMIIYSVCAAAIVVFLISKGANQDIDFTANEIVGVEYQRPLESLLNLIPQHQDLAERALAGDAGAKAALNDNEAKIDAAFHTLLAEQSTFGNALKFTPEGLAARGRDRVLPVKVWKEWDDLKSGREALPVNASESRHLALVADIRTMIVHAGDMSNLILDPVLDSYYLCDATLGALPQTQDRLAAVIREGRQILEAKTITPSQRIAMGTAAAMLQQDDQDRIKADIETSVNEDRGNSPSLKTEVPPLTNNYVKANSTFLAMVNQLATAEHPAIRPEDFVAAGDAARDASFKLWDTSADELTTLLRIRLDRSTHLRTASYIMTALGLLAIGVIVGLVIRSIHHPLNEVIRITKAISAGDLDQEYRLNGKNEIGRVGAALNEMIGSLKSARVRELNTTRHMDEMNRFQLVTEYTKHGEIVIANQNYLSLTGYSIEEVKGRHHGDFVEPGYRESAEYKQFWRDLNEGKFLTAETKLIGKDGREIWLQSTNNPVFDIEGEVCSVVIYSIDITARKVAEKQLLDVSRQAGMAEVATSVLHNVGNVLNSVNVSATLVLQQLKESKVPFVSKVAELMKEHAADLGAFLSTDAKGRQVPGYLSHLAGHLASEQSATLAEIESLRKNVDHIKDIVAMQQGYARVAGVVEEVAVADLLEEALRFNLPSMERHQVKLVRDYREAPAIAVEKHKALQILVNLLSNAQNACVETGQVDRQITLRISGSDELARISVVDNGMGIAAENLTRIFGHGFTTRKAGHGFGLHSACLAAMEMGGSLSVHSDGPGKGAAFTLELPCKAKRDPKD